MLISSEKNQKSNQFNLYGKLTKAKSNFDSIEFSLNFGLKKQKKKKYIYIYIYYLISIRLYILIVYYINDL